MLLTIFLCCTLDLCDYFLTFFSFHIFYLSPLPPIWQPFGLFTVCMSGRLNFSQSSLQYAWFFKKILFIHLKRSGKGGRKRGRETSIVCLPLMHPNTGTRPTTQACAQSGSRTNDPLLCRLAFNPLSHTN